MPTDYDNIRDDEIRKEAILNNALKLLGKMYTDRTHFVFELLQNAEDAGATPNTLQPFRRQAGGYP